MDSESPSALFGDAAPKDATPTDGSSLDRDDFSSGTTEPTFNDGTSFSDNTSFSSGSETQFKDTDFDADFDSPQDGELFDDTGSSAADTMDDDGGGIGSLFSTIWDIFGGDDE